MPFQIALGGEMSTLGAGIAEHAAAASQPVHLEPAGSQSFSSVMQNFGERVVAVRARSEGGARSASGIVSAAASLIGLRFEAKQPRQLPLEPAATLMDQQLWTDTHSNRSNVQNFVVATREGLLSHAAKGSPQEPPIITHAAIWYPQPKTTAF